MSRIRNLTLLVFAAVVFAACGCGSSKSLSSTGGSTATTPSSPSPAAALSADAASAATGDIPDNQVFLVFHNNTAGYSIKYPEGWTQRGSGRDVTFQEKNNLVHILVSTGPAPSTASVGAALRALRASDPSLTFKAPLQARIGSTSAIKATYATQSAPNPVTGKRVLLLVDRYELASGGRHAVVDLGTPQGVDNVDAYRMMIESFKWR
jgi:hypothetical protein